MGCCLVSLPQVEGGKTRSQFHSPPLKSEEGYFGQNLTAVIARALLTLMAHHAHAAMFAHHTAHAF